MRLCETGIFFTHKRHDVLKAKDCAHLVLAVAITSCGTTCHLVECLENVALLANSLYGERKGKIVVVKKRSFNLEKSHNSLRLRSFG